MDNNETPQVPCEHCQAEFSRLALALREAEVKGHRYDDLLPAFTRTGEALAEARAEVERLEALVSKLQAEQLNEGQES